MTLNSREPDANPGKVLIVSAVFTIFHVEATFQVETFPIC